MPKVSKARVEQILTARLRLRNPTYRLESAGGRVSGSVISETFKGKRDSQRQQMLWDALEADLGTDSVKAVGMVLAFTPDEWNIDPVDDTESKAAPTKRQAKGTRSAK